jgi:cell wall-associated NlpC family hydrolase
MATSTPLSGVVRHPWRITFSVVAGFLFTLPLLLPGSAGADTIQSAKAKAAAIEARLNQLNDQLNALDEKYTAAQIQLGKANDAIKNAEHQLHDTEQKLSKDRSDLRDYAISAYMQGDDTASLEAVLTSQGNAATARKGYLDAAAADRQDLIDRLNGTQAQVNQQLSQLHAARDKAANISRALASATNQEHAAIAEQQRLQDQATGEVARLLAQQQAAQAAALARQAAAAKAAALAAFHPVVHEHTGGGSTGGGGGVISTPAPGHNFVPPPGGGSGAAVAAAESQIGVPYVWGGASPGRGFDCSGLVMWAWEQAGVGLPHNAQAQYDDTAHISEGDLQPGDLVFFGTSAGSIEHVGMYVGGGTMVHAPHTGATVTYQSIHYWPGEGMWFGRVG